MTTDPNVVKKEADKLLKYKDLFSKTQRIVACEGEGDADNYWCNW
jgi:hypothetical protein